MNESRMPVLILAAKPQDDTLVPSDFFDSNGPYFKILQQPEYLRYSGWNLRTIDMPTIRDGNAWKVQNGERKLIILYQNLILLTAGSLGADFLAWGSGENDTVLRINPVAIAEYSYEFAALFHRILKNVRAPVTTCDLNVTAMYVESSGKKLELGINPVGNYVPTGHQRLDKDFTKKFEVDFREYNPRKVGFQILEILFRQFGYPSDVKMPYVDMEKREIDVDGIVKIGG